MRLRPGFGMTSLALGDSPEGRDKKLGRFDRGMVLSDDEFDVLAPILERASPDERQRLRQRLSLIRHCYLGDGAQWESRASRASRHVMLGIVRRALGSFLTAAAEVSRLSLPIPEARGQAGSTRYERHHAFQDWLFRISETRLIYGAAVPESDQAERKQRAYREAARSAGRLGVVLLNCDDGSEGEMLGRLPTASLSTFHTLENVIAYAARLRVAAFEAREESLRHRGPERPPALDRAVLALASAFEESGLPVTHTPRKKGLHYTGSPESKAGQLIFRFFRSVDPKITNTAVSTALARAIKSRTGATASMGGVAQTI